MKNLKSLFVFCLVLGLLIIFSLPSYSQQSKQSQPAIKKVNINTATAQELSSLPRIGPKKASAIIEFRNKNGKFKRIEDIMKVKGIGEKTFLKLKDFITVE
ncbi:MAG: ComEA family DNA-binding protein [Candidatus Aminicenantia bacterium]